MKEKSFRKGYDSKPIAYCEVLAQNPIANIIFLHGVKEHSGRYESFASVLADAGYNFYAPDLRAHGLTDTPGQTQEKNVFMSIIMDIIVWGEELKATGLPLIIMGHSFGSFLAQKLFSIINANAFVLFGSTYMHNADTFVGKVMAGAAILFGRGEREAKLVEKLSYGKFRKTSGGAWLSTSKESYLSLRQDELCGKPLNNYFYRSMLSNSLRLYGKDMGQPNKNTPILLASGSLDPVGKKGEGTKRLYDEYKKRGFLVQLELFEGLKHDIINDLGHFDVVYSRVLEFLDTATKNQ